MLIKIHFINMFKGKNTIAVWITRAEKIAYLNGRILKLARPQIIPEMNLLLKMERFSFGMLFIGQANILK